MPQGEEVRVLEPAVEGDHSGRDGTPGLHPGVASQFQAVAPFKTEYFTSLRQGEKEPYTFLPVPTLNDAPIQPFLPVGTPTPVLAMVEPSLETADLNLLTTGTPTGVTDTLVLPDTDTRVQNFGALPNGPFALKGAKLPYDSYTGDTTHRLFEMWQQSDCNVNHATRRNPSGCLSDLYPFVITNYTNEPDPASGGKIDDNGGGNSMAFYNVQTGDAPILKQLADQYSMSDNYHQAVMGGTGANHVMLGTGDAIFWSNGKGQPTTPPSHIANPDPQRGTDNVYTVDQNFDGNFTECGDPSQPGVGPIRDYLATLPYRADPNCEPNHFYMINNDSPGFLPDGTALSTPPVSPAAGLIPPTNCPATIGDALNDKHISWAYYGGAYKAAVALQHDPTSTDPTVLVPARRTATTSATSSRTPARLWATPAQRTAAHQRRDGLLRPRSTATPCRRCHTSSRTACSTCYGTQRRPSSTSSKRMVKDITVRSPPGQSRS